MKNLTTLSLIIISTLLNACSYDSLWTEQDKAKVNQVHMAMANSDPTIGNGTDEQKEIFCECMLEKTMEVSPNPIDQDKMSNEIFIKMTDDCIAKAKKK